MAGYRRRERIAYAVYGVATVVFAGTVATLLVRLWYGSLRDWVGAGWAVVILLAEAVLLALLLAWVEPAAPPARCKEGPLPIQKR